jgi:hypothetical protein
MAALLVMIVAGDADRGREDVTGSRWPGRSFHWCAFRSAGRLQREMGEAARVVSAWMAMTLDR